MLEQLKKNHIVDASEEILIVKNGLVTDTSFSNIVFYDGSDWITPDPPLLKGTKRTRYLRDGEIRTMKIRSSDISHFEKARLINAMLDLDDSADIHIRDINFSQL
jgi:4-amino-4-deoxychorismate lyase